MCRSASDSDHRFARKSVDRFAPSAVLDRKQPELMKIKPPRVWCWLERVSILGGRLKEPNRNQECSRQGEAEMSHARPLYLRPDAPPSPPSSPQTAHLGT